MGELMLAGFSAAVALPRWVRVPGTDPGSPRHVLLVSGGYGVVEPPAEPPLSPLMPTVIILDAERTLF